MIHKIERYLDGMLVVYTHGGSEFFDGDRLGDARRASQICRGPFGATGQCNCVACQVVSGEALEQLPVRFLPHSQGETCQKSLE